MEVIYIVFILVLIAVAVGAFFFGNKQSNTALSEARQRAVTLEQQVTNLQDEVKTLTGNVKEQETLASQTTRQLEDAKKAHQEEMDRECERNETQRKELKDSYDKQLEELKNTFEHRLTETKEENARLMRELKEANDDQLHQQMSLIKEQMQTTSENILKKRQDELKSENKEQVSRIIDPLLQSLKRMDDAIKESKEKHQESLAKLDATIQANQLRSEELGKSADRLAEALTGEVKIQGNFGELKLKQLLEDLGLKDGEQYSSQEKLRDKLGNAIKDDDGRGLIPDFILHFPNKRDVIVDSKMSFTAFTRYMEATDVEEKSQYLKDHIASVRAQVDRLSKKDYSKYLQTGYNKLNFVIMYVHTEGALNLALSNESSLWREAYNKNVLILGPQTMYMNLRILEMMWTQVRQLSNQEEIMKNADLIVQRTQEFYKRFMEVEKRMDQTFESMNSLKNIIKDEGQSIITPAKNLMKSGAREKKDKISLMDIDMNYESKFIDSDKTIIINEEKEEN
jgi:DNA recombination protein RmuC